MRKSRLVGLSLGALLAGCGGSAIPNPLPIQQQLELLSFQDCGALERYIEDNAVLDMRATLEQSKQASRHWGPAMAESGGGRDAASSSGPDAYTKTNTQVEGVDEADFVKNDGTRIFVLSGRTLYLNQSWPASSLKTVSKLEIEGWPREMFLDDDNHVVVFSHVYTQLSNGGGGTVPGVSDRSCAYGYCGSSTLKITVVDVSDLANPKVMSEFYQPGNYSNSRRIGTSVRLVMSDHFRWPEGVRWYPQFTQQLYNDKVARARAFDELMVHNEQLIRAQKLEQWLPRSYYRAKDGSLVELGYSCSEFHYANAPTKLGLVSVATLDLDPATLAAQGHPGMHRASIIAQAGEIYSSATGLYLASRHWWWWPRPGQEDYTYLYKFDLTNPAGASFVAAGGVEGHIVDQFSMDEHKGYLRVATTVATRVESSDNPWGRLETTNRLNVLETKGGRLQVIGRSEDLAPGERIFSSRFIGDKGFVVTFRQIDPFYTFDLSDPTKPRKVGELKVPGFSTYLHPIDENHLISIGEYRPDDGSWRGRSVKLSMYDVSDFANPKETFTQLVGNTWGSSEAMWNHKAFNYFPEKKLLAIPFYDWVSTGSYYWDSFISDLRVYSVDPATGFTPRGSVTMRDLYQQTDYRSWTWYWTPMVRRSVMADDYVYAIADGGIRVANVNALDAPIATVVFPPYRY